MDSFSQHIIRECEKEGITVNLIFLLLEVLVIVCSDAVQCLLSQNCISVLKLFLFLLR